MNYWNWNLNIQGEWENPTVRLVDYENLELQEISFLQQFIFLHDNIITILIRNNYIFSIVLKFFQTDFMLLSINYIPHTFLRFLNIYRIELVGKYFLLPLLFLFFLLNVHFKLASSCRHWNSLNLSLINPIWSYKFLY